MICSGSAIKKAGDGCDWCFRGYSYELFSGRDTGALIAPRAGREPQSKLIFTTTMETLGIHYNTAVHGLWLLVWRNYHHNVVGAVIVFIVTARKHVPALLLLIRL